jgi:hypothetical protein
MDDVDRPDLGGDGAAAEVDGLARRADGQVGPAVTVEVARC